MQETWVQSLGWDPLEKGTATHSVFWPGEFHGQRSLAGYSSWGHIKSDMTEQLFDFKVLILWESVTLLRKCWDREGVRLPRAHDLGQWFGTLEEHFIINKRQFSCSSKYTEMLSKIPLPLRFPNSSYNLSLFVVWVSKRSLYFLFFHFLNSISQCKKILCILTYLVSHKAL